MTENQIGSTVENIEIKKSEDSTIKEDPLVASELTPQGEKLLATLGYFGFLCVLPLVLKPKSELCQVHGKQALVIVIIFLMFSWLGWLSGGLRIILGIAHVAVAVWGMMYAWKGTVKHLPFFSEIAKKLKW